MSTNTKKDPAKEIGSYLLKGWTLLGESCPDCKVPLVEDKKKNAGVMLCVNCNNQYVREKDVEEGKFKVSNESTSKQIQNSQPTPATSTNNIAPSPTTSSTPIKKEEPKSNHQEDDFYDDDDDWIPPTEEELKEIEAARKRNDEISAKLSQKLLQGWAMIDIVCPACYTPLMRNKQKQLFCVACDTMVVSPSEFDPAIHNAINKEQLDHTSASNSSNNNTTKEVSKQNQTVPAQNTTSADNASAAQNLKRDFTIQKQSQISFSGQDESFTANKIPRHESNEDVHTKKTVDLTVTRLLTRLEAASAQLETTDSLDHSRQLCSFIRECGSALETMIAVQKALLK